MGRKNLCAQHHTVLLLERPLSISTVGYLHSSGSVLADSCVKGCTVCAHTFVRIMVASTLSPPRAQPAHSTSTRTDTRRPAPSAGTMSPPRAQPAHSTSTGTQHRHPVSSSQRQHQHRHPTRTANTQHRHRHPVSTMRTASSQHQHQHRQPVPEARAGSSLFIEVRTPSLRYAG